MRFNYPQHLLLDVKKGDINCANDYWVLQYSKSFTKNHYFNTTLNFINNPTKFKIKKFNSSKAATISFTTAPNFFHNPVVVKENPSARVKKLEEAKSKFLSNLRVVNQDTKATQTSQRKGKFSPNHFYGDMFKADEGFKINHLMSTSLTHLMFDINFIKKERLYTKLKYSRSPAYDIVSGGAAALLSGFIGFLISEKFGIELVDSGDFYIVFMYAVFIALSCRPLLRVIDVHKKGWSIFSVNHALDYFKTLFYLTYYTISPIIFKTVTQFKLLIGQPSTVNLLLVVIFCFFW